MERKMLVVFCIVGFLGVLSAGMGLAAEAMRTRATNVEPGCNDTMFPARILALFSGSTLFLAMTIFEVAVFCHHGGRPQQQQDSKRRLALICRSGSVFSYVIALFLQTSGAVPNNYLYRPGCFVVKPGAYAGAAFLSLANVLLTLTNYLISTSTKSVTNPTGVTSSPTQGGIAIGQPLIPPV